MINAVDISRYDHADRTGNQQIKCQIQKLYIVQVRWHVRDDVKQDRNRKHRFEFPVIDRQKDKDRQGNLQREQEKGRIHLSESPSRLQDYFFVLPVFPR